MAVPLWFAPSMQGPHSFKQVLRSAVNQIKSATLLLRGVEIFRQNRVTKCQTSLIAFGSKIPGMQKSIASSLSLTDGPPAGGATIAWSWSRRMMCQACDHLKLGDFGWKFSVSATFAYKICWKISLRPHKPFPICAKSAENLEAQVEVLAF